MIGDITIGNKEDTALSSSSPGVHGGGEKNHARSRGLHSSGSNVPLGVTGWNEGRCERRHCPERILQIQRTDDRSCMLEAQEVSSELGRSVRVVFMDELG